MDTQTLKKRSEVYFRIIQETISKTGTLQFVQDLVSRLKKGEALELILPDDPIDLDVFCKALLRNTKDHDRLSLQLQPNMRIVPKHEHKRRSMGYLQDTTCVIYEIKALSRLGWTHIFCLPGGCLSPDSLQMQIATVLNAFESLPAEDQHEWMKLFSECFPHFADAKTPAEMLSAARSACAYCGESKRTKRCSDCFITRYCSKRCQKIDHDRHARNCKSIRVIGSVSVEDMPSNFDSAILRRQDVSKVAEQMKRSCEMTGFQGSGLMHSVSQD